MEAKKLRRSRKVELFCPPRAFFQPSWPQVTIFIDLELVLAALGCLPGLSWEGLGAILASSRAYLGLSCGSFLRSSGCLGSPAFLSKICPRSVQDACHKCMPQNAGLEYYSQPSLWLGSRFLTPLRWRPRPSVRPPTRTHVHTHTDTHLKTLKVKICF